MRRLFSGLIAALVSSGSVAAAPADAPSRPSGPEFRWDAPTGCPAEAEVVAELERLLGGPLAARTSPRLTAIARVRQEPGGGFDLRLWTVGDEGTLQRSITHPECEALARAGALIAAMAIDPSVLERMLEETDTAEVVAEARTIEEPEPPPEPEPRPEPEPEPAAIVVKKEEEKQTHRKKIGGAVRIGAGISHGDLPGVGALLRLTSAAIWPRARLEFEASYGPVRAVRFDDVPDQGADLQLASGAVRGCPVVHAGRFEFPLCAGLEVGAIYGPGVGYAITERARQLLVAVHLAPAVFLQLHRRVAIGAIVEGALHVVRPRFFLKNFGEVYRAGAGSVRALLAIEVRFP